MPKPEPDAMEMAETEQELDEAQQRRLLTEEHGFTNQEAQLFLRIKNRGFEPLMPAHWQVDFGTMPDNLFFAAHEVGHIDSITLHGTFKATSAFQALVNLGGLVRTKQEVRKDPEEMILGVLRKYIVWSVEDVRAGLKGHPDIHPRIVLAGSYGKGPKHCEAKMQRRLVELATELRNEEATLASLGTPREPSASATLYGLAVSGCVVALVSLDARNTAAPMPKTLALLDFSDTTLDFWNAVAIALLVIGARDDEIERHEFYAGCALRKPPVSEARRRGWEKRRAGTGDEDA
ncbi:hypothetical protein EDC01DRAFT_614694 [Geopyxis carbonaria]|nr:hypothetical protein EDC01DRAFT_614694 [Geopyxis carbonaria]